MPRNQDKNECPPKVNNRLFKNYYKKVYYMIYMTHNIAF